jgi:hypothetical protein
LIVIAFTDENLAVAVRIRHGISFSELHSW